MSVKVTDFDTWTYIHDDAPGGSHGGTLDPATVTYATNVDGTHNHNFLVVPCPFEGCGSSSTWPVGGGADAVLGQQLFVTRVTTDGCPCGNVASGLNNAVPESHVHLLVARMDGEDRWALG